MTATSERTLDVRLTAIARHFELGLVQRYQRVPGTNQNYMVETDKGDYLFKLIVNTTLKDVLDGLPFLQRLEEYKFAAAAYYLKASDGQYLYHSSDCDAVVLRRLPGEMPAPSLAVCREVGFALALLHLVPCRNLPEKRHWLDAQYLPTAIETALSVYGAERLRETLSVFHSLKHFQPATFPQSIVHGDLDCSNCLFSDEKLVAFVDWQEIGVTAALMDFVSAVIGFCFVEHCDDSTNRIVFCPEYYSALYKSYTSIRSFSAYEEAHLNDALQYVGLTQPVWSMLTWGQYHPGQEMIETNLMYWKWGLDKLTLPEL